MDAGLTTATGLAVGSGLAGAAFESAEAAPLSLLVDVALLAELGLVKP